VERKEHIKTATNFS